MKPSTYAVLRILRLAGSTGATTHDLMSAGERFGGRIHELRRAGYTITQRRERPASSRYVLVSEPGVQGAGGRCRAAGPLGAEADAGAQALGGGAYPAAQGLLFDTPEPQAEGETPPATPHYDWDRDAA